MRRGRRAATAMMTRHSASLGPSRGSLVGKPASSALARKVLADGFELSADLCLGQGYEKAGIAKIAVVFRNLVLEHKVITEGVVREFGHEPVVLVSVALPVDQDV